MPGANATQKVGDRVGPLALEWDLGGITQALLVGSWIWVINPMACR